MSQTKERRMYLMWKAQKKTHDYRRGEVHSPFMWVARRFKTPIREVRDIIEAQRGTK